MLIKDNAPMQELTNFLSDSDVAIFPEASYYY